jgi:hypothetical protein
VSLLSEKKTLAGQSPRQWHPARAGRETNSSISSIQYHCVSRKARTRMTGLPDNSNRTRLKALVEANSPIPAKLVEDLLASVDREDQSDAYDCMANRWKRIQPELEMWYMAPLVLGYLTRSITEPIENADLDSNVFSSYEAARVLLGLLCVWSDRPDFAEFCQELVARINRTFLEGDEAVRDCIETGFLEHALEYPKLRPLFESWKGHPKMCEAHARALEWGLAHERI